MRITISVANAPTSGHTSTCLDIQRLELDGQSKLEELEGISLRTGIDQVWYGVVNLKDGTRHEGPVTFQ